MNQAAALTIDLRQMIIAIETAVSLVGMNDTNHGKRVGYIASQLGNELGFSEPDIQYAFDLGMLHDCGVSTEEMHSNLVNHFDWEDAHIHCEIGYQLLKGFAPLAKFAVPLLYHHTPWSKLPNAEISVFDARMANLTFLADRIDVLGAAHYSSDILVARKDIVESIKENSGSYFDPELVNAFLNVERYEAFWIALQDRHITRYVWDMGRVSSDQMLSLAELKQLSLIMSYVVDQKSAFTAQHSVRVADVAKFLAESCGLTEIQSATVEIAGLLHDLGKLHMPDDILEKPGPLDDEERAIMNQHSYETYEILRHIQGLDEVARLAAFHHEGVNGRGYPFHPGGSELSVEARIIAVADVFQALVQDRPYREGMAQEEVLEILNELAAAGKLDTGIVQLVNKKADECYELAKGSHRASNQAYLDSIVAS